MKNYIKLLCFLMLFILVIFVSGCSDNEVEPDVFDLNSKQIPITNNENEEDQLDEESIPIEDHAIDNNIKERIPDSLIEEDPIVEEDREEQEIIEEQYPDNTEEQENQVINLDFNEMNFSASYSNLPFSTLNLYNIDSYQSLISNKIYPLYFNLLQKYNEEFFEKSNVIIYCAWMSSGSIKLSTSSLVYEDGVLYLTIDRTAPQVGTCDMRFWLFAIEYDKINQPINEVKLNFNIIRNW